MRPHHNNSGRGSRSPDWPTTRRTRVRSDQRDPRSVRSRLAKLLAGCRDCAKPLRGRLSSALSEADANTVRGLVLRSKRVRSWLLPLPAQQGRLRLLPEPGTQPPLGQLPEGGLRLGRVHQLEHFDQPQLVPGHGARVRRGGRGRGDPDGAGVRRTGAAPRAAAAVARGLARVPGPSGQRGHVADLAARPGLRRDGRARAVAAEPGR